MVHSISSMRLPSQPCVVSTQGAGIAVIDDLNRLEDIRSNWTAMQRHPNADIDFYTGVVRGWGPRCTPHVLVLTKNDCCEAILVGRAENVSIDCKLGYQTLCKVNARQLTFIYGGMLGDFSPQNCSHLLQTVQTSLKRGEADLADFHFIRTDSHLYNLLSSTAGVRNCNSSVQIHRSTALAGSVDGMFGKLSPKVRKNLRWQEKKLLRDFKGEVDIRCFCHPDNVAEMFTDIESVAAKTYHRQLGVGFDGSEELRQRLTAEADRGRLRAYVLYLAGRPAAFWIATAYKRALYSDFMGYDPGHARHSPGMHLIVKTLESLCTGNDDPGLREVDWGLGDAQYKEVLGDYSWTEANIRIFGPHLRGTALRLLTTPIATADAWLKRTLAHSGSLQSMKTRWRRHLADKQVSNGC